MIIIGYSKGIQWNEQKIKDEIIKVVQALNLNRFPSSEEFKKVTKDSALVNAIRRYGGIEFWSKEMNLEQSNCTTRTGLEGELLIKSFLEVKGYKVEKMSAKHPYDLLINNNVKIDVKLSHKYKGKFGSYFTFNLEKSNPTCDIYILICVEDEQRKILIIPSTFLHQTQISMGDNTKYNIYQDRWDYIEQYCEFYKTVI